MILRRTILAALLLAGTARAEQPPGPMQYFTHPAASPLTGAEIVGPVRQNGRDVTVTTSMLAAQAAASAPVQSVFGRAGSVSLLSSDVSTALGFTPPQIGTASGTARDAAAAIAAETAAQATANAAIPSAHLGQPSGPAALDGNAKVVTVSLVDRSTIAPLTTTVGTSPTTIFPAGTYLSIRIALTATGSLACTGDGTTPALGGTGTASFGQDIHWPVLAGGAMPTAAVSCIAAASSTVTTEAH